MMALRWQYIGLVGAVILSAACEDTERRMEEASGTIATEEVTRREPPAEETTAPEGTVGMVPAPIERAEDLTQEIQSKIEETDWDDAAKKTRELQALSDSISRTDAPTADIARYDSAVNTLAANIGDRDKVNAGLAASEVQRSTLSMAASFSPEVPVAVGFMEGASWDAVYHGEASEWSRARDDLANLETQYAKVRAHLAQRDRGLAERVDHDIEELRTAITNEDLDAVKRSSKRVRGHLHGIANTYKERHRGRR